MSVSAYKARRACLSDRAPWIAPTNQTGGLSTTNPSIMSQAMNDDEVITELKKMVAFIRQEAVEKAREIQVKADEEFAIEKAKIVRQEGMNLDAQYEKKMKQVEVSQKMYVFSH